MDTLILSYPRSGNHFVRYLIELLSGRPTLGCKGNPGGDKPIHKRKQVKYLSHVKGEPIAVKRHSAPSRDNHKFKNLILIIRNPTECISSHKTFKNPSLIIKNLNFFEKFDGKKDIIFYEELISDIRPCIKTLEKFFDLHGVEDLLQNSQKYINDSLRAPVRTPVSGADPTYYSKNGASTLTLDHPLLLRYTKKKNEH